MSEATGRAFSDERRASAAVKDPPDKDNALDVQALVAAGSVAMAPPYDEVVRRRENAGVTTLGDARRGPLGAVTKSLDSKGVDAE